MAPDVCGFGRAMRCKLRLVLLLGGIALAACREPAVPLKIGFVGGLTGRNAGLAVAGRDGVLLAVEEFNRAGGVHGRPVEVITRDDRQDAAIARQVLGELQDEGAVAVIGPMTSAMGIVMQPIADQLRLVLISPTVATDSLTDRDDWFFRLTQPLTVNAGNLAEYVNRSGLHKIGVCLDVANASFSENWLVAFAKAYSAGGGRIITMERFKSGAEGGFLVMAERLLAAGPDAVIFIAGAMDTAMMAQQVRKLGSRVPLFATEWGFTGDVVDFGGSSVEGLRAFVTYNPDSQTPRHLAFKSSFEQRFGYRPSFAAVLAYESAGFLLAVLGRDTRLEALKDTLQEVDAFAGLQGEIRFNRFGDAQRPVFLATIRNGRFTVAE